jgi:anti-sigma-K factor RskA
MSEGEMRRAAVLRREERIDRATVSRILTQEEFAVMIASQQSRLLRFSQSSRDASPEAKSSSRAGQDRSSAICSNSRPSASSTAFWPV